MLPGVTQFHSCFFVVAGTLCSTTSFARKDGRFSHGEVDHPAFLPSQNRQDNMVKVAVGKEIPKGSAG